MTVRSMNKAIAKVANYIPCAHTRRAVMVIADELSKGMYENKIQGVAITSTAAELNKLDGVTASTAEINLVGDVTKTTSEINKLDQRTFQAEFRNASQAGHIYAVIPWSGTITKIFAVADNSGSSLPNCVFSFGAGPIGMGAPGFTGNYMSMSTAAAGAIHGVQWPSLAITSVRGVVNASEIMTFSGRGGSIGASEDGAMNVVFSVVMDIS